MNAGMKYTRYMIYMSTHTIEGSLNYHRMLLTCSTYAINNKKSDRRGTFIWGFVRYDNQNWERLTIPPTDNENPLRNKELYMSI